MHPRTEYIQSGVVRRLDVLESLTYQGSVIVPTGDTTVKVSAADTTTGFLQSKIAAGSGISLSVANPGANEQLTISASVITTDELAKVSSNDTTSGYLDGKLVAGANITLTQNNDGGNETLSISSAKGVTGFADSQNTASPNDVVNSSRLLVTASTVDADAVIQPKGAGSFLGQLADATTTGGNKRGINSVDIQTTRLSAASVASGQASVVLGGATNQASGQQSIVGGGNQNSATQTYAGVFSGHVNVASGNAAAVLGGSSNVASGYRSSVIGGESATASGSMSISGGSSQLASGDESLSLGGSGNKAQASRSATIGGQQNTVSATGTGSVMLGGAGSSVSGPFSVCVGGANSTVGGTHSMTLGNWCSTSSTYTIATGHYAVANRFGMRAHSTGQFSSSGDCQYERLVARRITTNNTPTNLLLDGETETANFRIGLANDSTYGFRAIVTARRADADNESACWEIKGAIDNNAGTTAMVGSTTTSVLGDDSSGTWSVVASADNTNDALIFTVTGENSKTIRWGAVVELMRVSG